MKKFLKSFCVSPQEIMIKVDVYAENPKEFTAEEDSHDWVAWNKAREKNIKNE